MNNVLKAALVMVGLLFLSVIVIGGLWLSAHNREVGLRNRAAAQQNVCKIVFDETWKIISQKCQIKDSYKDDFAKNFTAIMEGRYKNARGGAMMSWIQEADPDFDSSIYKDISVSIDAQRHKFTGAQTELIDIKREHDNIRTVLPSSIFVGGRPALDINIVTSTKTEEVFQTGVEDNVNISGK